MYMRSLNAKMNPTSMVMAMLSKFCTSKLISPLECDTFQCYQHLLNSIILTQFHHKTYYLRSLKGVLWGIISIWSYVVSFMNRSIHLTFFILLMQGEELCSLDSICWADAPYQNIKIIHIAQWFLTRSNLKLLCEQSLRHYIVLTLYETYHFTWWNHFHEHHT